VTGAGVTGRLPAGWYRVDGTEGGAVRPLSALGSEAVAWVAADGAWRVADAVCPHLGAHLGHTGALTEAGELRCGFHGWCFAADGTNVASSGGGPPVPAAALHLRPTRTTPDGTYAFLDGGTGVEPWEPVAFPAFATGDPVRVQERVEDLSAHQQVVLEGDFDLAHFGPVHDQHFGQEAPAFDGPSAQVTYRTSGRRPQSTEIRLDGLTRLWQRITLGPVVVGVRADYTTLGPRSCRAVTRVEVWAPSPAAADRTLRRLERVLERDIARDAAIWEHREYDRPGHLGPDDRVVARFRRWADQFYAASSPEAAG
jgi:phenylpropionate dioxygenase-like ring-hydroxylating dioxygenase large terminal subunit